MPVKLAIILGARPNFIKAAPLLQELERISAIAPLIIHTGQHYDARMSKIFFDCLAIPDPHYNLEVGSGSHARQTATIMERLENVFLKETPHAAVVFGDVNSTLAGALVAAKMGIPVVHVEGGLRSYVKSMPEEVNRVATDHLSDIIFCPTASSVRNLKKEGIVKDVYNVGDIMYDVFLGQRNQTSTVLERLGMQPKDYLLLTIHRPQSVDHPDVLSGILDAITKSGEKIIFPVHPRTKKGIANLPSSAKMSPLIKFIEPLGYGDMLFLSRHAKKIITDSGGVQKEAYWAGVPCVTLRDQTEWQETVKSGWNILVGIEKKRILEAVKRFAPSSPRPRYFGKGNAAKKIVRVLEIAIQ